MAIKYDKFLKHIREQDGEVRSFGNETELSVVVGAYPGELVFVEPNSVYGWNDSTHSWELIRQRTFATVLDLNATIGKDGEIASVIGTGIYFRNGTNWSTAGGGQTTVDVISDYTVGSVNAGDLIPAGTDIQALVNQVFLGTFYPTFTAPTYSLTSNQANGQEIGATVSLTLTYNFNRGSINGKRVGGIWQPATFQDYRAGSASNYTIDGTVLGAVNTKTIASYQLLSTQTFSGTVTFGAGPQPYDSDGANYSTPLAGGSDTKSTTITARYPYFWGKVTGGTKPTKNQTLINSGTKVVADSSGTITVNFASSASDWLWFAIPATSTSKTTWYETALNNGPIGGASNLFDSETISSIDSPTALWNGVNYKIYVSNYQSSATSLQLRN